MKDSPIKDQNVNIRNTSSPTFYFIYTLIKPYIIHIIISQVEFAIVKESTTCLVLK